MQEQVFQGDLDEYFNVGEDDLTWWPVSETVEPYTRDILETAMEMGAPMRKEWRDATVV